MDEWVIEPALQIRYKRFIEPKLSAHQKRLIKKLAAELEAHLKVDKPDDVVKSDDDMNEHT